MNILPAFVQESFVGRPVPLVKQNVVLTCCSIVYVLLGSGDPTDFRSGSTDSQFLSGKDF